MSNFISDCFSGPNLPASLFLSFIGLYWVLVIVGALSSEWLDLDLNLGDGSNANGDMAFEGFLGIGMVGLRALNLGHVPTMLWVSIAAVGWWGISLLSDQPEYHQDLSRGFGVLCRNVLIGAVIAKLVTQPLRGRFAVIETRDAETLIGERVVITSETTTRIGQATCPADAAPLLLNVRTEAGVIEKGAAAIIVAYDKPTNMFIVARISTAEAHS